MRGMRLQQCRGHEAAAPQLSFQIQPECMQRGGLDRVRHDARQIACGDGRRSLRVPKPDERHLGVARFLSLPGPGSAARSSVGHQFPRRGSDPISRLATAHAPDLSQGLGAEFRKINSLADFHRRKWYVSAASSSPVATDLPTPLRRPYAGATH